MSIDKWKKQATLANALILSHKQSHSGNHQEKESDILLLQKPWSEIELLSMPWNQHSEIHYSLTDFARRYVIIHIDCNQYFASKGLQVSYFAKKIFLGFNIIILDVKISPQSLNLKRYQGGLTLDLGQNGWFLPH